MNILLSILTGGFLISLAINFRFMYKSNLALKILDGFHYKDNFKQRIVVVKKAIKTLSEF